MGKKILVIPDSFKGSMSSEEVTDIIASTAQKAGFE
ncbi:MAG: glycerate kinase, partial [Lachnospiraceae bacterium]|nr:glycerate kinase [Lachnospiraceae bacterium]